MKNKLYIPESYLQTDLPPKPPYINNTSPKILMIYRNSFLKITKKIFQNNT